jgi:trk system potassium uptake protein
MTYIVIGLGNFGIALAERLTKMGHDVIGVDADMQLVEKYKTTISSTICVNLSDSFSLKALPLKDADEVIVTLGENIGQSILIVALLKQCGTEHIVARGISNVHKTILETMGVDDVIMPELYAAEQLAIASESTSIKGVFIATDTDQLIDYIVPNILIDQTLQQADIENQYNLKLVGVKRRIESKNFLQSKSYHYEMAVLDNNFIFQQYDQLLLFGNLKSLSRFEHQVK